MQVILISLGHERKEFFFKVDSNFHPTRKYNQNRVEVGSSFRRSATLCV